MKNTAAKNIIAFLGFILGGIFYASLALVVPIWFLIGATAAYVAFKYIQQNEDLPRVLNLAAAVFIGIATTWLSYTWYWEFSPLAQLKESQEKLVSDWEKGARQEVFERIEDWSENSHPWEDENVFIY